MNSHRTIDLQRPVVDGKRLYQAICLCGIRSVIGSRAVAEGDQKQHKREAKGNEQRQARV